MKKLITACLALALAASAAISASAASDAVLKGTPKIDGVMEEIWTQSYTLPRDTANKGYTFGGAGEPYTVDFNSYYLWDDSYFYICTVVTDDDLVDVGADTYKADPKQWLSDAVETGFNMTDAATKFKVHTDAFGHALYIGDGTAPFTVEEIKHAVKINKDGYVLEIAFPMDDVKKIMKDDKVIIRTQVNDISKKEVGVALYTKTVNLPLSDTAVVMPKEPAKAPATADPALFALAAAAGAAFITAKARRK